MSTDRAALIDEAKRVEEFSLWNSATHFNIAAWAGWIQAIGGAVPIVLGAIGGWKFLTDPSIASPHQIIVASLFSLAAGTLGSVLSYWNLAKVRLEHFMAAAKYKTLENQARRAHQIHAVSEPDAEFRERVLGLGKRYDELGESSPQSMTLAFLVAGRAIRRGRFQSDRKS